MVVCLFEACGCLGRNARPPVKWLAGFSVRLYCCWPYCLLHSVIAWNPSVAVATAAVPVLALLAAADLVAAADLLAAADLVAAADSQVAADTDLVEEVVTGLITMDTVTDIRVMLLPFTAVAVIGGPIPTIPGGHPSGFPAAHSLAVLQTKSVWKTP